METNCHRQVTTGAFFKSDVPDIPHPARGLIRLVGSERVSNQKLRQERGMCGHLAQVVEQQQLGCGESSCTS